MAIYRFCSGPVQWLERDPVGHQLLGRVNTPDQPLKIEPLVINPKDDPTQLARYDYKTNTILLSPELSENLTDAIPYLVFELCNAARAKQLKTIDDQINNVGLETTVQRIERCEYESALETNRIVLKWINEEKLPKNAPFSRVFLNFEDHYRFQQLCQHSQKIAARFEGKTSDRYGGTWETPPKEVEIPVLKALLELKLKRVTGNKDESEKAQQIIEKILKALQATPNDNNSLVRKMVQEITKNDSSE